MAEYVPRAHKDAEPVLIWQIEDVLSIGGSHVIIWKARVWTIMVAMFGDYIE